MLGHPVISKNYDTSVWIDASVTPLLSIKKFVETYLKDAPFAAFLHHERNSIKDEASACLLYHKDTKEKILETLHFLETENFPDNLGLFEMTVFIKKHNDPKVVETMKLWFDTIQKYSKRDQLSFMYSIWKTGLLVSPIDLNVWDNKWFSTFTHASSSPIEKCYMYYGDSSANFNCNNHFTYKYLKDYNKYTINTIIPVDTNVIEVYPTDAPGVCFDNISLKPTPSKTILPPSIPYKNNKIFQSEYYNAIKFFGDFKKGQILDFSISLTQLNCAELYQVLQQLQNANQEQEKTIAKLSADNASLKTANNDILNSKTWKTISRVKNVLKFKKSN